MYSLLYLRGVYSRYKYCTQTPISHNNLVTSRYRCLKLLKTESVSIDYDERKPIFDIRRLNLSNNYTAELKVLNLSANDQLSP